MYRRGSRRSYDCGGSIMKLFRQEVDQNGIATLWFDTPNEKINKFSLEALDELESNVDALSSRNDIKVLVIRSTKRDIFIAGADMHAFAPAFKDPQLLDRLIHQGHRVFSKIENLPFPTIAFIQGACVGGGTEMA